MYKIIILMLFMQWFISVDMLHAKDIANQKTVVESNIIPRNDFLLPVAQLAQEDSMATDTLEIKNLVNVPFRKVSEKHLTGAITVINPEDILKYDNVTSVSEVISGRVPGIIGGLNVHGLGNALVVIDGIPRPINSVAIEEVEQITIIKDANAAILYGVQGRNGVILITTKRGKINSRKITANVMQGFSNPIRFPKYLGSAEYMELYNEARANDGMGQQYAQNLIDGTRAGTKPQVYPDVNYYNSEFLKSMKPNTRAVMEFSGGNKNAQYYLNVGWSQTGTLLNMGQGKDDKDTRLNVRSNINFRINDLITSYVDIVAAYDISRRANGDYWSDASTLLPNLFVPLIDTALIANKKYVNTAQIIDGRYLLGGKSGYLNNVWGNLNLAGYSNRYNSTVQFNQGINVDLDAITKGLSMKTFIGIDFYNQYQESQSNTYAVYQPVMGGVNNEDILSVTKIGIDKFEGTQGIANTSISRNFGAYLMLNYNRVFGQKHAFGASVMGYGELYNVSGISQRDKNNHLGANFNYAYDNKYLLDLNAALVTSAKLAPSNRLGFSPSIGLGWVMSEENFLKGSSVINYLKLKATASRLNTDLTIPGYNLYEGQYVGGTMFYVNEVRSVGSTRYNNVKNYNLFYEVRNNINLGVEAVLFNKSLWLDANIFREHITGMVAKLVNPVPAYLGGFYSYTNNDENMYKGAELGATWRKQLTNDFSFEIGANMTYLQTEVIKKEENYEFDYLYRQGKPVSAMFGLEALGLFKDPQDIADSPVQSFGVVKPGDIKYKDQNGDLIIDGQDEIVIGNYTARLSGSLNLLLRYKNLSFFALASGSEGSESISSNSYYWVNSALKYSEVVLNRWTPATAATATYPRLTSQGSSNNYRASTYWMYDNSRITINRIQLSYNTPKAFSSKLSLKNLNIFVRASNIASFAKNVDKMELSIGGEPQYRYFAVGLKADF